MIAFLIRGYMQQVQALGELARIKGQSDEQWRNDQKIGDPKVPSGAQAAVYGGLLAYFVARVTRHSSNVFELASWRQPEAAVVKF